MPEPIFEIVDINTLIPREGNPNELTDEQMKSLDYAIDRFGFLQPLVVNQDGIIVDGAHRYDVLRERGIEQVRVSRVITRDENELKLLSQTLNKLRGSHNLRKDISEMEILMGYNPDELKSLLGFDETGLDLMRQQLATQEQEQIFNINGTQPIPQQEKKDVEFKANLKHQCPSCGYIFK